MAKRLPPGSSRAMCGTSGAKPRSTTQSMRAPGMEAAMSCTAGMACTTSPREDSLTMRMFNARSVRGLGDLRIRLGLPQQRQHVVLDAMHRFLRVAFEAQHQDRRGVRGAQQPEAIR